MLRDLYRAVQLLRSESGAETVLALALIASAAFVLLNERR